MTNLITSEDTAFKQKVIKYIWPVAATFFVGYILLSFFVSKEYVTGIILLANFTTFILTLIFYFKTKNVLLMGNILATFGMPVILPWLITGGPGGVGAWWSLVYVVWAFIVTNKKSALFWLSVNLVIAITIIILSQNGLFTIAYSIPALLNLMFAYFVTTLYVYFLVSVLDYYLKLSQKRLEELEKLNKELEKANILSEQSKAAKQLFLASMSHEIRTPLNSIIGFQQLLKETNLNQDQKEFVDSIDFAGKNLLVIINDILDLTKMEVGKFEFDEVEINMQDTIKSVVELVIQRAREKNLKLFVSIDPQIPQKVYGDNVRLSQILLNLVGNAIKFTETGEIKISASLVEETQNDANILFSVEDTGIGIPKEKLENIFESFTQVSVETTRKYGGTGLGLTISKNLVEMQGGTMKVESEVGKGSTFSFQLAFNKTSSNKFILLSEATTTSSIDTIGKKLKILLVEDILLNQRLATKVIEKWGHDLDIAENGKIAVEKATQNIYDLILMDIQMPIMDGYEATQLIRNLTDEQKRKVPIIALTAHASHSESEKCINLGMNAYLTKPFNQRQLQQVISQVVFQNR